MAATTDSTRDRGPTIRATDVWRPEKPSAAAMHQLLSDEERARLIRIASIVRFKKGELIYREGDSADTVFNIISGVVKAYRTTPDGGEHIAAFLFPEDLFGLSEQGYYTNSASAISPMTAYALPIPALQRALSKDADLEFHVIVKLCQELRQAQRHGFLLAQKRTLTRVTMFLQLLKQLQSAGGEPTSEIHLPMDRSDIAEYIGMSLAAVSRAFRSLTARRIITIRERRHVKIIDRDAFEKLATALNRSSATRRSRKQ
jgi:CRP/FNR family transcriptional regulator, anaerobic regulatory protein